MVNAHHYGMEIHEILKKYPFCTALSADDFELLPLYHIDTALTALHGNKNMQPQLDAFRATYLTEDIINLSMRALLEKESVHFAENLLASLKNIASAFKQTNYV